MTFEKYMNPPAVYDEREIQYKFGLALRYAREQAGISQSDLCRIIKLNRSCMSQYESGITYPRLLTTIEICNALGIKVDELLELCKRDNFHVDKVHRKGKR